MKKINDLFSILLYIFTAIIIVLFFFLYRIETNMKHYNDYMDSFDTLLNIEIEFNTFLEKRDKFVNFDFIVEKTNKFEWLISELKSSDFKNQFGKDSYLELNNIKKVYLKKKALIEKFKSRQATNLNSIHYVYELNQYFTKNNKIDEHLKTTINSTLFMIMQYFINLNNTKALISQNLEYIEYENKKIFSKELDLLITHSKIILENN